MQFQSRIRVRKNDGCDVLFSIFIVEIILKICKEFDVLFILFSR
jgi:hypothetical protein